MAIDWDEIVRRAPEEAGELFILAYTGEDIASGANESTESALRLCRTIARFTIGDERKTRRQLASVARKICLTETSRQVPTLRERKTWTRRQLRRAKRAELALATPSK